MIKPAPGKRKCNCRNEVYHRQIGPGMFQQMTEQVKDGYVQLSQMVLFQPNYCLTTYPLLPLRSVTNALMSNTNGRDTL